MGNGKIVGQSSRGTAGKAFAFTAFLFLLSFGSVAATLFADSRTDTDQLIVRVRGAGVPAPQVALGRGLALASRLSAQGGAPLTHARVMGDGSHVMKLAHRMPAAQIEAIARRFDGDAEVIEILPDRVFYPALVPTDPLFTSQWALSFAHGINAPAAWDMATGTGNLVIAIVDTGKLPHSDLAGRWVGGYDFVGDTGRSNDGDGRDADSADPGDWVTPQEAASLNCAAADSSWHGTAMAGVIGANAGNGIGIAGINWGSKLLPVRVVGRCGAYESDIADGIRWAVGIAIPNVPANPNVANVINLSLSTENGCSMALQSAINEVLAAGVPIVVAAGNKSLDAGGYSPGNCTGVITVGAVDKNGGKPDYANTGSRVALSAPGGLGTAVPSAVLTTLNSGLASPASDNAFYAGVNGTSIAAAQVTGVASLMLSVKPTLRPAEVRNTLANTVRAFPNAVPLGSTNNCDTSLCGTGIVDAANALATVQLFNGFFRQVAAGQDSSFALRADGRVVAWGANFLGSLGTGSTTFSASCSPTTAGVSDTVEISAGRIHVLSLRSDGAVWAWGNNTAGELGTGNLVSPAFIGTPSPVRSSAPGVFTHVAAGYRHSLALRSDGTVWAWGNGQPTPAQIPGLGNVIAIGAARVVGGIASVSFALRSDLTVWTWSVEEGDGVIGSLEQVGGLSAVTAITGEGLALKNDGTVWDQGIQVAGLTGVKAIGSGAGFHFAVKADGTTWAWGSNYAGQLGDGTSTDRATPVLVPTLHGASAVSGGYGHSLAIKPDGSILGWGRNSGSQLGLVLTPPFTGNGCDTQSYSRPQLLPVNVGVEDPSVFAPQTDVPFSTARTSNTVKIPGVAPGTTVSVAGGSYSLGCTASFTAASAPVSGDLTVCLRQVSAATPLTSTTATLSLSGATSLARPFTVTTMDPIVVPDPFYFVPKGAVPPNTVFTSNTVTITGIDIPVPISIANGSYSIGCSGPFTTASGTIARNATVCVAVTSASTHDTVSTATLTVGGVSAGFSVFTLPAAAFSTPRQIAAGGNFSLALRSDGTLFAWGNNGSGQLALDISGSSRQVPGISGVIAISAGLSHTLTLRSDGTVWASGNDRNFPVRVSLNGVFTQIAAGNASLALRNDGSVWSWGNGQAIPVQISGIANVIAVAAGRTYPDAASYALKSDSTVWSWTGKAGTGVGGAWQQVTGLSGIVAITGQGLALRNDGTVWSGATQVAGLANVMGIASGPTHHLAVKSDGTVWAWGKNDSGQLGDGTYVDRPTPVRLPTLHGVSAVAAGFNHSLALKPDGSVWAWGSNSTGALGTELGVESLSISSRTLPRQVYAFTGGGYFDVGVADPTVFAPQTDVSLSSLRTSNAIAIGSLPSGTTISISGGEYSLGCNGTFTASSAAVAGTITVCVRQVASAAPLTTTTTVLTLSGATNAVRVFNVTTLSVVETPDRIAFVPKGAVPLNTPVISNTVTVTRINAPVAISVANGSYSIGCNGTFTSASGTVANGDRVCVRVTSATTHDTPAAATLTVGTTSADFTVFTVVDPGFKVAPRVGASGTFSIALRSDGSVFGWGVDGNGALGLGIETPFQVVSYLSPVQSTTISGVKAISVGADHTLALRSDGTVWSWGANTGGKLGDSDPTAGFARFFPVRALTSGVFTQVAAGYGHSLALRNDGTVWAWGNGQLAPVRIDIRGLADIKAIAASRAGPTSFALASDLTVWTWTGVPGGGVGGVWQQVPGLSDVAAITGEGLALRNDGSVWKDGAPFGGLSNIVAIASGTSHHFAIRADGSLWAWGSNSMGQLGDGSVIDRPVPVQAALEGMSAVAAGSGHSLAVAPDGSVFAWGASSAGQLGLGTYSYTETTLAQQVIGTRPGSFLSLLTTTPDPFGFLPVFGVDRSQLLASSPVTIRGLVSPAAISIAGGEYSINNGPFTAAPGVVVEGDSVKARLASAATFSTTSAATVTIGGVTGRSSSFFARTRADLASLRVVPQVAAGDSHSLSLNPDGSITGTGYNANGQLGNGTAFGLSSMRPVSGLLGAVSVASGAFHGLALKADGRLVSWGSNTAGQLGADSPRTAEFNIVDVVGLTNVARVSAGRYHSVALKDDGTVWAWGLNSQGQLGTGSAGASRFSPVQVSGLASVIAIAAGGRHTLALLADGTVRAWGANDAGQLGDNTTFQRSLPGAVPGLTGVVAIAAGEAHSLAIKSDGSVVAWGLNSFGQLGDGTTTNRLLPVKVSVLGKGVGLIAAGANHSLAVKVGGALYAWGNNANSQLGNGANTSSALPLLIASPAGVVAISGGARHSAAIDATRKLHIWGDNFFGQVGNRSGNYNRYSTSLNLLSGDSAISTGASGSGTSVGTGSNSGSSVLEIDGQQTGFDFGSTGSAIVKAIAGKYKNASTSANVTGIDMTVSGAAFTLSSTNCGSTLIPDAECAFTIAFNPPSALTYYGELVVSSSVAGSPEKRTLVGTGVPPASAAIAFAKTGLDFAPQFVGTPSSASYLLTNTGSASLSIASIVPAGDFSATHNCVNVAPAASCALHVTFNPSRIGPRTGILSVASNASGSPHGITVSGTGVSTAAGELVVRYRLYSPGTFEHLYTTDRNEYNVLPVCCAWLPEGPIYQIFNGPGTYGGVAAVPYYRLYNPFSYQHHWTTDFNEYNILATLGWIQEGTDGYILPSQAAGSIPLYRLYLNAQGGLHLWTTDLHERNVLTSTAGWVDEGIAGYVIPLP